MRVDNNCGRSAGEESKSGEVYKKAFVLSSAQAAIPIPDVRGGAV